MDTRAKVNRLGVWLARAIVSGLFAAAAVPKALHPAAFATEIEHYRLVSPALSTVLAAWLPYLELVAAAALWAPKWRRAAGLLIALMLLMFVIALASAWARGLDIHCGCFGSATGTATTDSADYAWWIVRDLLLAALLVWQEKSSK